MIVRVQACQQNTMYSVSWDSPSSLRNEGTPNVSNKRPAKSPVEKPASGDSKDWMARPRNWHTLFGAVKAGNMNSDKHKSQEK